MSYIITRHNKKVNFNIKFGQSLSIRVYYMGKGRALTTHDRQEHMCSKQQIYVCRHLVYS